MTYINFRPRLAALACASALLTACGAAANTPVGAAAPGAVSQQPQARQTAYVEFVNKSETSVTVRVLYSYPLNPVWVLEKERCVARRGEMKAAVTYGFRDPQLRIQAIGHRRGCGTLTSDQAHVDVKSISFHGGEARFDAAVLDVSSKQRELCVSQNNKNPGCRTLR